MMRFVRQYLRGRRRRPHNLERDLRPVRRWWVDARIPREAETRAVLAIAELTDRRYGPPVINPSPAPDGERLRVIEITFPVWASSAENAGRIGYRMLDRAGIAVYACRGRAI